MSKANIASNSEMYVDMAIPAGLYGMLKERAIESGTTVNSILRNMVQTFATVDSTKPIVLNDAHRQHLDKLLGRNFSTGDELVSAIQRALSVRVDSVEIPLTPYLLERLKSRAISMELDKFLQITIKRLLEEFAGVR